MKNYTFIIFSAISVVSTFAFATPKITLTNKSPFYLNSANNPANCPTIAPGKTATLTGYQCGYNVCVTNDYDGHYCYEPGPTSPTNPAKIKAVGGYATYISMSNALTTCAPGWSFYPYSCTLTPNSTGGVDFNFHYKSMVQLYTGGANIGKPVELGPITHYSKAPFYKGVNISGLEYDGTFLDALYQHPDIPDARSYAKAGMNLIRLPIRAEFVMTNPFGTNPDTSGPVNSTYANFNAGKDVVNTMYLSSVYDTLQKYLSHGMSVELDLHNYMRFCDTGVNVGQLNEPTGADKPGYAGYTQCNHIITPTQLATIWSAILNTPLTISGINGTVTIAQLAHQYAPATDGSAPYGNTQLIFGVMNEPFSAAGGNNADKPDTKTIFNTEINAAGAIRKAAPQNLILLSGNGWDPLHAWSSTSIYGADSDAAQFTRQNIQSAMSQKGLNDSHIGIEVHQYFDYKYSGTHPSCNTYASESTFDADMHFASFTSWLKANQMPVILSEFGAPYYNSDGSLNKHCIQDMTWMLHYMNTHGYGSKEMPHSGFIGWAAWRSNRNLKAFNSLQSADQNVYGAPKPGAVGIVQGPDNDMMSVLMGVST